MSTLKPPRWAEGELEDARLASIALFREERLQEPLEQYIEAFDEDRGAVEDLLEATVDLTDIEAAGLSILTDPALLKALRYLAGPPISTDDLKTLAEATLSPSRLRAEPAMAKRVIDTITMALDHRRFPWVMDGREPEPAELDAATLASAALMATQRLSTSRRTDGKTSQEQAVADALLEQRFVKVAPQVIKTLAQAPHAGEFCRETMFGGRKADFVIGLWDGRKMPLECKVSNSSTNSIKRLNNDAAVKASQWLKEFGTAQTVPAAMLSGVFKLRNLEDAQNHDLTLFWAHDLTSFVEWIQATGG
jgi:hypothetical protein